MLEKRFKSGRTFIGVSLFLLLSLFIVACANTSTDGQGTVIGGNQGSATTVATTTTDAGSHGGVRDCPAAVSAPSHWDSIVHSPGNLPKIESVTCASLLGSSSLQALIKVRHDGTGQILNLYVFDNITASNPTKIFTLEDLYKGSAKISIYNTIATAEVDLESSLNKGVANVGVQQDLFREFKWNGTHIDPIVFPGIYPDLTRYQAEYDQDQVNKGQDAWKMDAKQVAQHFVADPKLFDWSGASANIVSGGGTHDAAASITVKSPKVGGGTVKLTLSRLEGNTNGGIWQITDVATDGMALTLPAVSMNRVSSPFSVNGKGNAFEGVVGSVVVLNDLYDQAGKATAHGVAGNGNTTFTTNVNYTKTFTQGYEEGIVVLYSNSQADGSISGAVMMKALLG